jgi:prepilin peptidase CpaA
MIFPLAMIFAGIMDLFTLTIPNRVSLVLIGGFFAAAIVVGMPLEVLAIHIATGLVVLALTFGLFAGGYIGGGDAKILAVAALWLGYGEVLKYLALVAVAGGLLALFVLLYRAIIPPPFVMRASWAVRLHDRKTGIPYGLALAAAALWLYPTTMWFRGLAG